jgi:hypothetical protein
MDNRGSSLSKSSYCFYALKKPPKREIQSQWERSAVRGSLLLTARVVQSGLSEVGIGWVLAFDIAPSISGHSGIGLSSLGPCALAPRENERRTVPTAGESWAAVIEVINQRRGVTTGGNGKRFPPIGPKTVPQDQRREIWVMADGNVMRIAGTPRPEVSAKAQMSLAHVSAH